MVDSSQSWLHTALEVQFTVKKKTDWLYIYILMRRSTNLPKRTLSIHRARHLQNKADAMQILNETYLE